MSDEGVKDWDAVLTMNAEPRPGINTIMKAFKDGVRRHPNKNFLGTRPPIDKETFGPYQWLTWTEVDTNVTNLARGIMKMNFCPEHEAEGRQWRFVGIWARNRQEWLTTLLAGMHFNITNVGFYDAMSINAVDFILKQTKIETIFCEAGLVKKVIDMKKK